MRVIGWHLAVLLLVTLVPVDRAAALSALRTLRGSSREVPINRIHARGTPVSGKDFNLLAANEYTASRTAESWGLKPQEALLGGGGAEWALFPAGSVPNELEADAGPQALLRNQPNEFCTPGDQSGFSLFNVTMPTVVPFILPKDHPGRSDAALLVLPGGGNRFLSWSKEGTQIAKWLNSIGYSAFVLKYRVPSNSIETASKGIIDAQRALSLIRQRAAEYSLNATRIGIIGFSAGGLIAARSSTARSRAYTPIDAVDSLPFQPNFVLLIYGAGHPLEASHAPPTFLAIALDDQCVPPDSAGMYYMALDKSTGPHELHMYSTGHHGFGDCSTYVEGLRRSSACAWTINAELFLEALLGTEQPVDGHALGMQSHA